MTTHYLLLDLQLYHSNERPFQIDSDLVFYSDLFFE